MVGTAVDDDEEEDEDGAITSSTSSIISTTLLDERLDARNGLRVVERRPRAAGVVAVAAGVRLGAALHKDPY